MAYPGPWERLGIVFVAGCHDAEVLRQSAFPKNKRVSAQNSPLRGSNSSLRPFNGKSNCLRTSTHRAKIRIKHNTKSFSCRDWPMIMNSIEGLWPLCSRKVVVKPLIFRLFCTLPVSQRLRTVPLFNYYGMRNLRNKTTRSQPVHTDSWLEILK